MRAFMMGHPLARSGGRPESRRGGSIVASRFCRPFRARALARTAFQGLTPLAISCPPLWGSTRGRTLVGLGASAVFLHPVFVDDAFHLIVVGRVVGLAHPDQAEQSLAAFLGDLYGGSVAMGVTVTRAPSGRGEPLSRTMTPFLTWPCKVMIASPLTPTLSPAAVERESPCIVAGNSRVRETAGGRRRAFRASERRHGAAFADGSLVLDECRCAADPSAFAAQLHVMVRQGKTRGVDSVCKRAEGLGHVGVLVAPSKRKRSCRSPIRRLRFRL